MQKMSMVMFMSKANNNNDNIIIIIKIIISLQSPTQLYEKTKLKMSQVPYRLLHIALYPVQKKCFDDLDLITESVTTFGLVFITNGTPMPTQDGGTAMLQATS
jgi:hypothetical protein